MKIKATTNWRTRDGKRRRIRLYECWINMLGRLRGSKSRNIFRGYWDAKDHSFSGWEDFRQWAIASGYRAGVELDRKRTDEGYHRHNLQWLPKKEHTAKSLDSHRSECDCSFCRRLSRRRRQQNAGERW